ncbi:hypothetical protein B0H17DRAFT_832469, partial [Mycena rosella]
EILARHNIRLRGISVAYPTDELFAYLLSYVGLEQLTLWAPDSARDIDSNLLARTFFARVLPRHRDSLRSLSCRPAWEGEWCMSPQNLPVVAQLGRLQSLRI